ncbi:Kynurenine formamidase [Tolypocladium ophioglossoides CBS 100239]|uniref:Kynurenine formamidase n=1 Tax=Tolypocladium ophioglossoides (strain CBS 100239) TaxID=1163406 RepID=A0A0L0NHB1_TOLOC|nr:Kynurenine formamidase [Tolypocladium ophioglossoides CBS 100239]
MTTDMAPSGDIANLTYTCCQYGDHALQRVGIWQHASPQGQPGVSSGHWVIFIHGGAWRDPRNTLEDFMPSIKHMLSSHDIAQFALRGFVSIDYRLSPYADFPQDPAEAHSPELRRARHPDHILDVRAALKFLESEYQLAKDYVLVGHSAGATLAYQLLMGEAALAGQRMPQTVPLPAAVIGISGIYDLVGLNNRHGGNYAGFISAAFGTDQKAWQRASPASFAGSIKENWPGSPYSLLAHSAEDSLIDSLETESMAAKLAKDGVDLSVVKDLTGEHDFVWQDGSQVARLVAQVLERLAQAPGQLCNH